VPGFPRPTVSPAIGRFVSVRDKDEMRGGAVFVGVKRMESFVWRLSLSRREGDRAVASPAPAFSSYRNACTQGLARDVEAASLVAEMYPQNPPRRRVRSRPACVVRPTRCAVAVNRGRFPRLTGPVAAREGMRPVVRYDFLFYAGGFRADRFFLLSSGPPLMPSKRLRIGVVSVEIGLAHPLKLSLGSRELFGSAVVGAYVLHGRALVPRRESVLFRLR